MIEINWPFFWGGACIVFWIWAGWDLLGDVL
jgi:hypothetical protein